MAYHNTEDSGSRRGGRDRKSSRKSQDNPEIARLYPRSSARDSNTTPAVSASATTTMAPQALPRTAASSSRAGDTNAPPPKRAPSPAAPPKKAPPKRAPSPAAPPKRGPGRPPKRARLDDTQAKEPFTAANGMLVPSFSAETFQIYNWKYPTPKNFPDITASRIEEKKRLDDATFFSGDGADDWSEFADDLELEGSAMARGIASIFMNRAKKAHISRRISWNKFEDEEIAVHTPRDVLCNTSRLQVFDQIKERLCNEVFLEHYDPKRLAARQDSVMPPSLPGAKDVIPAQEKEVAGWDNWTPIYKGTERIENSFDKVCNNCGADRTDDSKCPVCKTVVKKFYSIG